MITNGGVITVDGNWSVSIFVTDINVTRKLQVKGNLHVGGLMLRIAEDVDVTKDWSDHALWWPEKNKWLTHTRSTLDQYRVHPDALLEFTPMHKIARVQTPDLQVVTASVNFSVPAFNAAVQLCKELGIRHQEELSFKRYIPPEVLVKGADSKEYQANTMTLSSVGKSPLSSSALNLASVPKNAPIVGQKARSELMPVSASTTSLNKAADGTWNQSRIDGYNTLTRNAASPYGTMSYSTLNPNYNLLNNPGLMTTTTNWEATLNTENLDKNLIYTPKTLPPTATSGMLRPKNYAEKAALNAGWLDSSRSLLEQGIVEHDFVLLRFKYLTFFDLNPKIDHVRINQIYEQAKWAVLNEEVDTNETEAYNFAALQLQIQLKTESRQNGEPEEDVDDVDVMLTDLENLLEGNWVAKYGDTSTTGAPQLADYLQFFAPKKNTVKNWRRAFFVLQNLSVHWYNNASDVRGPPMGRIYLRGADISYDVSVPENKYNIKLMIPSQDGLNEFWLKCDSEQRYAKWLAACQLAARGKTMADSAYSSEVEMVHSMLVSQHPSRSQTYAPSTTPQNINTDDYLPQKYARQYRSEQSVSQRIIDGHSRFSGLGLVDAKLQYIKSWQQLREFAFHYFVVRIKGSRNPELLVITHNRMIRMNLDSEGVVKVWPYANMIRWHVNWEIRHIFVQMEDEDIEFTCLSADCKIPHEFIGGYIFSSTRSKDKNQILDDQLFHQLTGGWTPNT